MHNASKVQMGSVGSNIKQVINAAGDPATFPAGLVVHLKSDKTISLTASDGSKVGVSLGASLSDTKRVAICIEGVDVPVQVDPTGPFVPTVGAQVQVHATSGKAVSSGTAVNAYYSTVGLTGVKEDGTNLTDPVSLINLPGGL